MTSAKPVPFSEPPWLCGHPSPYHTDSHRELQIYCREFISENSTQHAMDWEGEGDVPPRVYSIFAENHMLIPSLPSPLPLGWLRHVGIEKIGQVKIENFNYLHNSIFVTEMMRSGLNGPRSSVATGFAYGLPPLLNFGSESLKKRFVPDILLGKKRICIAITEPDAGSDVANIRTMAKKSKDGKHFIVNGAKKWITNGLWSDYASMCVRTGGRGASGLSVLLVPLKGKEGVNMRRMKASGQHAAGTTSIELDDVKVPVENLLGKENEGMKYMMTNFNHERLTIATGVTAQARVALSTAFEYCMKREAFGAPLISQPVVCHRLAKAGAELETKWAWVESFVYQMCRLKKEDADVKVGGLTALAKAKAAMVLNECAQCAQLLFGGNGYTTSGQGELVELIAREVGGARIPGGRENVILDLSVRQLYKNYQRTMKANL